MYQGEGMNSKEMNTVSANIILWVSIQGYEFSEHEDCVGSDPTLCINPRVRVH